MPQITHQEISSLIFKALEGINHENDITEDTMIFGHLSPIESFDFVTILAEIESSLESVTAVSVDVFELLIQNQQEGLTINSLARLIADSLDG